MANISSIMRLLQFTDSTFPVGTFSFSNGLETAAQYGLVHDAATLEQFTWSQALQGAYSDGVVAILAHRAALAGDYDAILEADARLLEFRMNDEARLMLRRMGKKLAELSSHLADSPIARRWLEDIKAEKTPGCYPVAQGIVFAAAGIGERDLFCSSQYGIINMVLSAALRCVRVSHYDTQEILFRFSERIGHLYDEASQMTLDDMHSFVPQIDILASLHEKGNMRMFMN
ncbi:MAG: urease accessory protein UreF [Muribaculaceae bacterium]|nr:urease accessory protein UreF [Muribaculaceae bacterium]